MRRFTDASTLVADLLDRLESHSDATRLFAHVDYDGFGSIDHQDACVEALQALERAGGVALTKERRDGETRIGRVRLADPAPLYAYLGRKPALHTTAEALGPLRARVDTPKDLQALLDEVQSAWSRNVGWSMLRPGQGGDLTQAVDLALALARRASGFPSVIDYRSFSRRAVGDSKSLERLSTSVVAILQRLFPEIVVDSDLDDAEVFASLGVERLPQPLLVSGNFSLNGTVLDGVPYFGIPPESAHLLTFAQPVGYLLTIENFTSFVRHAREIGDGKGGITLYTGGFPARTTLHSIVDIAQRAQAPIFHWGDIDPGGLHIFVHLERALRDRGLSLRPHLMSADILHRYGRPVDKISRRLTVGKAQASAIELLWDKMANSLNALELEQEALEPRSPV